MWVVSPTQFPQLIAVTDGFPAPDTGLRRRVHVEICTRTNEWDGFSRALGEPFQRLGAFSVAFSTGQALPTMSGLTNEVDAPTIRASIG